MQLTNTRNSFGLVAIILHWVIALIVIGMIGVGLYMISPAFTPLKGNLYRYHKEFGILIFMLVTLRLIWRLINVTPRYPSSIPRWQQFVAHSVHWLLYGFLLAMPITGYLRTCALGYAPSFFGLFTIPAIVEPSETLGQLFSTIHQWLAYSLILLICGHAAGAFEHHFIEKDNILLRMLGRSREPK